MTKNRTRNGHPRKTLIKRGEEKVNAKLTEADVREARKLRSEGYSWGFLAIKYNVVVPTIRRAVFGERWSHVQ